MGTGWASRPTCTSSIACPWASLGCAMSSEPWIGGAIPVRALEGSRSTCTDASHERTGEGPGWLRFIQAGVRRLEGLVPKVSVGHRSLRASFGVLLVIALLVGCSGGGATPNPSPTQPPLLIDTNKLITWEIVPGELVGVMVIQKLQNIGTNWIQVAPRDSTYEIKAPNGNVVAAN